jgi:hemoglobin
MTQPELPSAYQRMGGDTAVRALVERFYALMDATPEFYGIRKLHPADLANSTEKLYLFLSGWLGGPQLYVERFGHPMLRARHLPFPIGESERDQWLACMSQAMTDIGIAAPLRTELAKAFFSTADWMRNQRD